jgi:hypothetical protein
MAGCQRGHHVAGLHRVALAQCDARQPAGQRGRDAVAVGAAGCGRPRRCVVSKRPLRTTAVASSTSSGRGAKAHRQQCAQHGSHAHGGTQHRFSFDCHIPVACVRLVGVSLFARLEAATMSSRSMRRRTTSALASAGRHHAQPAQA